MKIAFLVSTFPPYWGGMGNVCYYQAFYLAKLGHQVTVFTPLYKKGPGLELDAQSLNFKVVYLEPLFKYRNSAFLPQILKLKDFDLIHLHYPFFGAELVLLNKIPLILQYHMDPVGRRFLRLFFSLYSKFFLPKFIKKAEKIIVSSFDYAENSNLKKFLSENKFLELPLGVDVNFFKPEPKDFTLQAKHKINPKDKVIIFVGGLDKAHYFKGVEYLLKAFAKLKVENPELKVKLLIVGEGELRREYEKMTEILGVEEETIFAGNISQEILPKYYNLADLLVLPSIDRSEAFGLVLLEAMACEKATVASNLPGVRTVVENNKTGLLVEPKNVEDLKEKLEYLLKREKVLEEFGKEGRKRVEKHYDWQKIVQELELTYIKIIS